MENNLNILTEFYDIKRQNIDWEIKLENNNNYVSNDSNLTDQRPQELSQDLSQDSPQNRLQIIISDNKLNNYVNKDVIKHDIHNELIADNNLVINSTNSQLINSSLNQTNDGIKNVEQYVERRKINGITWYYCKWSQCQYGSNKSNHLVTN